MTCANGSRSNVKHGQWIVIPGAGGGLGHFAVQYARAMGMRVIAIDGGDAKRDLCKQLGAEVFIDFQTTANIPAEVMKVTGYGAHGKCLGAHISNEALMRSAATLVTAASKAAYDTAPALLRPTGTLVAVGMPSDPTAIAGCPPVMMVSKRLTFVGSMTGTLRDVEEALDLTARGLVRVSGRLLRRRRAANVQQPILTKGKLEDIDKYIALMEAGQLAGRAVLQVAA